MRPTSISLALVALLTCSCGQSGPRQATEASFDAADIPIDAPSSLEAGEDGAGSTLDGGDDASTPDCTYGDGGSIVDGGGRFQGSCAGGCPAGTICAVEIGGVAGGGGEYCAPVLDRCKNDVSCACLASCLCGSSYERPERCTDEKLDGSVVLSCDNGIR